MTDEPISEPTVTSGEVVSASDTTGTWLSPPAAASRLGVSERTLWRHVNAGRYHKRVVAGRAEILVPEGADSLPDNSATAIAPVTPDAALLAVVAELKERRQQDADLIDRLTGRLTGQAEEIGKLKQERDDLAAKLATAGRRRWRWWPWGT